MGQGILGQEGRMVLIGHYAHTLFIGCSLIVECLMIGPPFGELFLSSGKHKKPDVCGKLFVAVFPSLADEADRLFRQIISSMADRIGTNSTKADNNS